MLHTPFLLLLVIVDFDFYEGLGNIGISVNCQAIPYRASAYPLDKLSKGVYYINWFIL
jgi:hypothetical protein